jgi:hypothetical protein
MVDAHSGVFEVSTHVRAGFLSKKGSLPDISVKRAKMTLGSGTLEEPAKKLSGTSAGRSSNEIRHKRGPEWRLSNRAADANAGAELRRPCRLIRHVANPTRGASVFPSRLRPACRKYGPDMCQRLPISCKLSLADCGRSIHLRETATSSVSVWRLLIAANALVAVMLERNNRGSRDAISPRQVPKNDIGGSPRWRMFGGAIMQHRLEMRPELCRSAPNQSVKSLG